MTPVVVAAAAVAVAFLLAVLGGRAPSNKPGFDDHDRPPSRHPTGRATRQSRGGTTRHRQRHRATLAPPPGSSGAGRTDRVAASATATASASTHRTPRPSLGEPLWSIVRPGAKAPDHDDAHLSTADIAAVLDRLEAL